MIKFWIDGAYRSLFLIYQRFPELAYHIPSQISTIFMPFVIWENKITSLYLKNECLKRSVKSGCYLNFCDKRIAKCQTDYFWRRIIIP